MRSKVTALTQVRAGNSTLAPSDQNSSLTTNTDCGDVDGRTSRVACCGLAGVRYVTVQVTTSSSPSLRIGKLLVKVALPLCDPTQVIYSRHITLSSEI